MDPERIKKLPAWARDELLRRDNEITRLRDTLAPMFGQQSNIEVDPYGREHAPQFLHDRTTIRFRLNGGDIEARLRKGLLELRASGFGNKRMVVLPHVTNVVSIALVDDPQSKDTP